MHARVTAALKPFRSAPHVTGVADPYTTPGHLAADGHIAYATIQFDVTGRAFPGREATALMHDATAASGHGVTFSLGGDVVDLAETPYGGASNGIGVGAAAIVLLIAFGSLLAMGLPIATALMGIGSGLALIALIGHIFPAPSFSPVVVGLDRPGRRGGLRAVHRDQVPDRAVTRAPSPATRWSPRCGPRGRSVLTAGTTVVIGMLGLLVLRQALLNGVAIAAAATVAMTVLASLTLLPALLGFTGTRLARPSRLNSFFGGKLFGRRSASREGRGHRAGRRDRGGPPSSFGKKSCRRTVGRRGPAAPGSRGPGLRGLHPPPGGARAGHEAVHAGRVGAGPGHDGVRQLRRHGAGVRARVRRAAHRGGQGHAAGRAEAGRAAQAIEGTPGIAAVTPPVTSQDGQAAMMIAYPATRQQDPATNALVNRIDDTVLPHAGLTAYLTGPNAGNVAFANLIGSRLPWLIGVVVALSMALLLTVFRSVVIAVKAALMNLLSVCAAYGVLVAVTQWGWLGHVFGFPEKMPVTTWVPVFLFVILFGLSMDYEVFLLSRIREEYDRLGDNSAAVARGLAAHRPGDLGRRGDHGGGVPVLRPHPRRLGQADRPRPGRRGPGRRHRGAAGPGPGGDGTARPGQLVAAGLAGAPAAGRRPAQVERAGLRPGRGSLRYRTGPVPAPVRCENRV